MPAVATTEKISQNSTKARRGGRGASAYSGMFKFPRSDPDFLNLKRMVYLLR
jgi:hypothetical protein